MRAPFARCLILVPYLPFFDADSVEEKVIPMLEWLQAELRASPQEVRCEVVVVVCRKVMRSIVTSMPDMVQEQTADRDRSRLTFSVSY